MTKYIIKVTTVCTHPNFAGEVAINYYGRNDESLGCEGSHYEKHQFSRMHIGLDRDLVREYGYSRRELATRNWSFKNPNEKYWKGTAEIMEVEV